ncbi:MAG: thymidine phosphorylase [Acidimicrobiia bacterium]|nr:thymidine phosphorylase [Acidimicrobiia bacterium]MDH3398931.1 thymidine phosphorylase [Acidimicrobiia bacterium]MDH5615821.1 thymidine phosphorylase [Acidimicrobiia bacterium]
MTAIDLIERKRDGGRLSTAEIGWLIKNYTSGSVTDYQMAAMLMAAYIHGLDRAELFAWTDAMLHSGDLLDLSAIKAPKIDKHSTGGVGDKVSIPLAPMVAACGVAVPMMSGRGLGHTGGTLDKLETIPGFTTNLDPNTFARILSDTGLVLGGQSKTLVPADQKLYALRDATGTVPSIPLIASSIMSKKLAEDLDGLVLDVKVGEGAFMESPDQALELAETLVGIGQAYDLKVVALLTNMDAPLGREVGNANEIAESIAVLAGGGPDDLVEITYALGSEMLQLAGMAQDDEAARRLLRAAVDSGAAMEKFAAVIEAQGGDPRVLDHPGLLPKARYQQELPASRTGYVTLCDARNVGVAAMRLGAGRERKEDEIDPAVGISIVAKPGEQVDEGQPIARISFNDEGRLAMALPLLKRAFHIASIPAGQPPLILGEVRS